MDWRVETKKKIAVMREFVDGAKIEYRAKGMAGTWMDGQGRVAFNWDDYEYRIKPVPREWWAVVSGSLTWWYSGLRDAEAAKSRLASLNTMDQFDIVHVREVLDGLQD